MTDRTRTFARHRRLAEMLLHESRLDLGRLISLELVEQLVEDLKAAGWTGAALSGSGSPEIRLSLSLEHAFTTDPTLVVFLAETRALYLLNPNPFPRISLLPKLRRRAPRPADVPTRHKPPPSSSTRRYVDP